MASRGGSARAGRAARTGTHGPQRGRARERAPPPSSRARIDLSQTRLRAFAAHPDRTAALLIALLVLAYLWPALIGGQVLSPAALLRTIVPWASATTADDLRGANPLLFDVPGAVYPWRDFAREMIRHGTFPAWSPGAFGGVPFYSNPQNGLFTPFNLPLWILPLNYGLGLAAALKLWAGGFGSYLLVRELRLGFLPGLLAGVAFAFSALNITWLTHDTLPAVAVMLPWAVWFVERIFARGQAANALGVAVVVAIGLGGGHPGMQVHLLGFVALYAVLRAATIDGAGWRERLQPLGLALGGIVLGALLMAFMLLPEALSSRGTLGTVARHGGRGTLPGSVMPFDAIKTVLFPDWWGRPTGFEAANTPPTSAGGSVNYNERTFYVGAVALLLACVGLLAAGDWRRKAPFAVLGTIGLAVPLHAPGIYWLVVHLPFFRDVQNQRMHFAFAFAVAVLSAFGLRAVLTRSGEERRQLVVPGVAILVGLVAFASAGAQPGDMGRLVKHFLRSPDYVGTTATLAMTSVVWFLLFAVGVGAALLAMRRWPWHGTAIVAAIVLLAAADALHFAHGYQPMGPASKVYPPTTPAIAYLQRHADEGRFMGLEFNLTNDWSMVYGLHDVRGYDAPYPTLRFYALWRIANPQQTNWQPFGIPALGPDQLRVISVLGARYVLTDPGVSDLRGLRRVYAGDDATIFRNALAPPRALVPARVEVAADEDAARAALVTEGFDPGRSAVMVRDEPGVGGLRGTAGSVRVVGDENSRVVLGASLRHRGLVVLNDQLTNGWSVQVDGRDADVVRVNEVMRGVVVGAGRHEVVWRYRVPGLRAGLLLSLVAFAVVVGGAVATMRRRRRLG